MLKLLFKKRSLFTILLLGLLLRTYNPMELFQYGHDQDLIGWFVKDIVVNHNLRLIGQQTSQLGVFIGPLFYYVIIPFYLITNMDPIGGVIFVTLIGLITIYSFYYVFKNVFDEKTGLIAAAIYATSFSTVLTDREVVPTTPVMLWSIWFLYDLHLLLKGKFKFGLPLLGVLVGLIWHINMGLVLLTPVAVLAIILSKKLPKPKTAILSLSLFLLLSAPLILFELRHNFLQSHAIISSLAGNSTGGSVQAPSEKIYRVAQLVNANIKNLLWGSVIDLPEKYHYLLPAILFAGLAFFKKINKKLALLLALWVSLFVVFLTFNSIIISEYYLNSINVVWTLLLSLLVNWIISSRYKNFGVLILAIFISLNINRFIKLPINKSGYIERKAIVAEIARDSRERGYPCVAASYIVSPGRDLGYRYFFWLQDLHVNSPKSLAPVYSIVFPHSLVDSIDKSFGALGLIYPDYDRYTKDGVANSCSGDNSNLTDPLFGYTN